MVNESHQLESGPEGFQAAACLARALTLLDAQSMLAAIADRREFMQLSSAAADLRDPWTHHVAVHGWLDALLGHQPVETVFELLFDAGLAARLRRTRRALQPGFEECQVDAFRRWVCAGSESPTGAQRAVVTPAHLVRWSRRVLERRREYAMTGWAAAAIPAGCELCIELPGHVARTRSADAARITFGQLCSYWTASPERRPAVLFSGIVAACVTRGYADVAMDTADRWRQRADEGIETAAGAATVDEHDDGLYAAHSDALAAAMLYRRLAAWSDALDERQAERASAAVSEAEEVVARLQDAFTGQVLDLELAGLGAFAGLG